ncbi:hypothetical protein GGI04_005066, partial [Coemansia thaxteri]
MNHFFYDFTKSGSVDITNDNTTLTISSVQHNVDVCICGNCKTIRLKKEADERQKWWNYH